MKAQLFAAKTNSRQQSSNLSASPRFILFWQDAKSEGVEGRNRRRCCLPWSDRQTSRDFLNRIQREPRHCCVAALCLALFTHKNVVVLDKVNSCKTVLVWFSFTEETNPTSQMECFTKAWNIFLTFIWATENNQQEENLEGDQTLFIKLNIGAKGYTTFRGGPEGLKIWDF